MTTKQIEEMATNFVRGRILPSNCLSPFINDNDKGPSWDGDVYLYSDESQTKEYFVNRVPVQVKGHLTTNLSQDSIKYDVKLVDLENYRKDGAMIYFVVYIDPNTLSNHVIYYATLTPTVIKGLLDDSKSSQYKRITFNKFPTDHQDIIEVFSRAKNRDLELIEFFVQCFDRPAFQHAIRIEGCMDDFEQALSDTIMALNTGYLRSRNGHEIKRSEGKGLIRNAVWRAAFDHIVCEIDSMRNRLQMAKQEGSFREFGCGKYITYLFEDYELADWFDRKRVEILKCLHTICTEAGINPLNTMLRDSRW